MELGAEALWRLAAPIPPLSLWARSLFFADTLLHHCDMCRAKTKQSYRCQVCDFDVCPPCFNKKDKATGEGMLRGDKVCEP